jgi:hypothetical protein
MIIYSSVHHSTCLYWTLREEMNIVCLHENTFDAFPTAWKNFRFEKLTSFHVCVRLAISRIFDFLQCGGSVLNHTLKIVT